MLKDPNYKIIAKHFNSSLLKLPKIQKSVKDYKSIVGGLVEKGLTKPALVSKIIVGGAEMVLKADKAIGLATDIVKISGTAVSVGSQVTPVLGQVSQIASTTFALGKGLKSLNRVAELDKVDISNKKLAQGFGYVKHSEGEDSEISWSFTQAYLDVPFPCVCESSKQLHLAQLKYGFRGQRPPHRAAWWTQKVVNSLDRRSITGIVGNAIPVPPCLVALRYARGKLSNKSNRKLISAVPGVGSFETLRGVSKFLFKKLITKTLGLRRTAEAIMLWGAARHAHEVTDFAILVTNSGGKPVPCEFPKLSSAKEAVANGCPMAQATIAALVGGVESSSGWERAMQIICANDGWKIIAATMKSV